MKYIISRILLIALAFTIVGCKEEATTVPVPAIKTIPKETQVLFSETNVERRNYIVYYYLIQGYSGLFKATGFTKCQETFKIEIGKAYQAKLNYVKDRPVVVEDLCEMTAILKRDNPNM